MKFRPLLLCVLIGTPGCGQQKSETIGAKAPAVEIERILGEEDAADAKGSPVPSSISPLPDKQNADGSPSVEIGVDSGRINSGTNSGKDKDSVVISRPVEPRTLDLSKIEEMVYKFNDAGEFKVVTVKMHGSSCSFATKDGVVEGSFLQCAALKIAVADLNEAPYRAGAKCEGNKDQLYVKAAGLSQIYRTSKTPESSTCNAPELPADAEGLMNNLLMYLPN